ncbi:MAG: SAM-dependent methyltransferase [Candidatus Latescibacteria bacterium]|nr:SAM-dependent methyltransferase [Candidatus Latescibacterota bacterium]
MPTQNYKTAISEAIQNTKTFLRLTLTHPRGEFPWIKIIIRPVQIKNTPHLQITHFSQTQDITENIPIAEAENTLENLLTLPFTQIHTQTTHEDLHIRITKKGKALFKHSKPSQPNAQPNSKHNRVKHYPLSDNRPDTFLQNLGIMDHNGRVRPPMRDKFKQINAFLDNLQPFIPNKRETLTLIDCGCGSAYLTFAAYHYLNNIQNIPARFIGIDRNASLISKCRDLAQKLGWSNLTFHIANIAEFTPQTSPDIVFSLHACDTATDDAIARAVQWNSPVILAAPCCQHELRSQLDASVFAPVMAHGILKGRTADILTDTCRAQILRILGYRTDVTEFIDSKHTPKNLLIRAKKTSQQGNKTLAQEYCKLRDFWHIQPCLERLLSNELTPLFV